MTAFKMPQHIRQYLLERAKTDPMAAGFTAQKPDGTTIELTTADRIAEFEQRCAEIADNGEWAQMPCRFGNCPPYCGQLALIMLYPYMPNSEKYSVVTEIYTMDGYGFPKEIIKDIAQYRPADYLQHLPQDAAAAEHITVYRASTTPPSSKRKLRYETSWTLSETVANQFYYRMKDRHGQTVYIYRAEIDKADIIAFLPCRCESEILQHGKVKHIAEVAPVFDSYPQELPAGESWNEDTGEWY